MKKYPLLTVVLSTFVLAGPLMSCASPHPEQVSESQELDYNSPLARATELDPGFIVAGYLPFYKAGRLDRNKLNYVTDLIVFSVGAREDGGFNLPPKALVDQVDTLRRDYGVRPHLALTDHEAPGKVSKLGLLARSAEKRKLLAESLRDYLVSQGYAGAVFDWEYPRTYRDKANYVLLLKDVRDAFAAPGLQLGVAVSPWHVMEPETYQVVDHVHLMTYDDHGRHSTYAGTKIHLQKMIRIYGAPAEKILLGLPFYGRGYNGTIRWTKAKTYRNLAEGYNLKPDQDSVAGFYFNGPQTIREKVRLARDYGLAGVMIWEISQDAPGEKSLLKAIASVQNEYLPLWNPGRFPQTGATSPN